MSKPLTRTQINEKKFRRINDKSLRQLLIHRFLNNYGYDEGEVTAAALVKQSYSHGYRLPYRSANPTI